MSSSEIVVPARKLSDANLDLISAGKTAEPGQRIRLAFNGKKIPIYPNDSVSLSASIEAMRGRGVAVVGSGLHNYTLPIGLFRAHSVAEDAILANPANRIIRYSTTEEAHQITNLFVSALTDEVACEAGVIDALNWCIYEVLDNVFQHSQAESGHVMMQMHAQQRRFVIAVGDAGRGIHRAMAAASDSSKVDRTRLTHAHLAIGHALEQGVTSKGNLNQGNGLHGLRRSVEINGGSLTVRSGRGLWSLRQGEVQSATDFDRPLLDSTSMHSTTVDWRLDCATPVSINDALGRAEQGSPLLEEIEVDEGYYQIEASEIEAHVGSREAGARLRTRILNFLANGAPQIVMDLSNVGVVSSSFADEVAGKLAVELGVDQFQRRIFFEGLSQTNDGLIKRAIELRLAQEREIPSA